MSGTFYEYRKKEVDCEELLSSDMDFCSPAFNDKVSRLKEKCHWIVFNDNYFTKIL